MLRVLVVGDVRLYRDGLAASLQSYDGLTVVGATRWHPSVFDILQPEPPDVLVLDVASANSVEFAERVRRECPTVKVIAFAVDEREAHLFTFAKAGVAGYVSAEASVDELVAIIRGAVSEELVCSPKIIAALVRALASRAETTLMPAEYTTLTARQREILRHMCEGLSNKEIAQACHISEATVKNHVHQVLEKMKVSNRCQAAARAAFVAAPAPR